MQWNSWSVAVVPHVATEWRSNTKPEQNTEAAVYTLAWNSLNNQKQPQWPHLWTFTKACPANFQSFSCWVNLWSQYSTNIEDIWHMYDVPLFPSLKAECILLHVKHSTSKRSGVFPLVISVTLFKGRVALAIDLITWTAHRTCSHQVISITSGHPPFQKVGFFSAHVSKHRPRCVCVTYRRPRCSTH